MGIAPTIQSSSLGTGILVRGSYNVISGFRVADVSYGGVELVGGHNVVSGTQIDHAGSGVWIYSSDNLVTGNYVHDLKMVVSSPGGSDDYGATGFWVEAPRNEISFNRCVNCQAPSYDYGLDGGFVDIWNNGDDLYLHHNEAFRTNGFLEVGGHGTGASARRLRVAYNLLDQTGELMCLHVDWMPIDGVTFDNNTVIGTSRIACVQPPYPSTLIALRNNIFYQNSTVANFPLQHTNNLYTAYPGYTLGPNESIQNPQFVDPVNRNYRLKATSPAVNAGLELGYKVDLDGHSLLPPPDLGAYELHGALVGPS